MIFGVDSMQYGVHSTGGENGITYSGSCRSDFSIRNNETDVTQGKTFIIICNRLVSRALPAHTAG